MGDRQSDGRFGKGNKAAVGNKGGRPRRAVEEKYMDALRAELPIEEFRELVREMKAIVRFGKPESVAAFRVLAAYAMGNPTDYQALDLTSEGEPIRTIEVRLPAKPQEPADE